jgi:1-phosphatidylinositol phosphodiesterase
MKFNYLFILLYILLNSGNCIAASKKTILCVHNKTTQAHNLDVTDIDNFDWDGVSRPDNNFRGLVIGPGETRCNREETNTRSKPAFTFLVDGDPTRLLMLGGRWFAYQSSNSPNALWGDSMTNAYPQIILEGYPCNNDPECRLFQIRQDVAPSDGWMGQLKNETRLNQITIPGTHDSAAYQGNDWAGWGFYIAQYMGLGDRVNNYSDNFRGDPQMSIYEQLMSGVRFLDLRARRVKGGCALHHGNYYLNQGCGEFMDTVYGFLRANPSETVVVSVKEEDTPMDESLSFEETINLFIKKNPEYWYVGNRIPSLGINTTRTGQLLEYGDSNVRGRIVLMRRYSAPKTGYGIDANAGWPDNDAGITRSGLLYVQDCYGNFLANSKWGFFASTSESARASDIASPSAFWYINFSSGYYGIPQPYNYAKNLNFRVRDFYTINQKTGHFGTVVMDFMTPELAKTLYSTNFSQGWGRRN